MGRPLYLVSREECSDWYLLDRRYQGPVIPQIIDFGSGEGADPSRGRRANDAPFGIAFLLSNKDERKGQPVAVPECYKPPEHIFGRNLSLASDRLNYGELNTKTDVWAMGATVRDLETRGDCSPADDYTDIRACCRA